MPAYSLPDDSHPLIQRAHEYWLNIHPPGGGLPGRTRLDPAAVPSLLPYVWLVDVQREPLRFRYRLLGTAIRRVTESGEQVVGRWIDEVDPAFAPGHPRFAAFAEVAEQGRPGYRKGVPAFPLGLEHLTIERIFLPLAADGRSVDMLFCLSLFMTRNGQLLKGSA
ncbi:PAS domain-containing protein [Ferrovibrio sp.]|uniref:PAS domain-containing protein n=1 Tax=Ferrovibrio sp. TaxID=1917215 RepID=UPI00262ABF72|nr:PAS domain-containing protein [Ferrovibrio sp.]